MQKIDHIVVALRDLAKTAAAYERLGFTLTPRAEHPPSMGTANRLAQFAGRNFIELLEVDRPAGQIPFDLTQQPPRFGFGVQNRRFLERRQGISMLVLASDDARGDLARVTASGATTYAPVDFERRARLPDGQEVTVAFSLAFARDTLAPGTSFAVCQQHYPENFWNSDFQKHANGAIGIAGVVMVAENPTDHHIFLSAFAGERALQSTSSGITIATPRGDIQVMDAAAFENHFADRAPDAGNGARLAALRFRVRQLPVAASALHASGIGFAERIGRIVVPAETAMGATIVFEPA